MRGVNKAIIVGRATRDTELRFTGSGKSISNMRLATNRMVRGKDGELTEHPQYHTVICWDKLAEQTGKHVTKGKPVYVEGRLETRTFTDKEGKEREVTEIIASDVQFLEQLGDKRADLPTGAAEDEVNLDDIPF